jgi:hypothetical protein
MATRKKTVTKTLDDGYRVTHHPPTQEHPGGKMVLQPGQSRLRERLLAAHDDHHEAHTANHARKQDLVDRRRMRMKARGVPAEKRCV